MVTVRNCHFTAAKQRQRRADNHGRPRRAELAVLPEVKNHCYHILTRDTINARHLYRTIEIHFMSPLDRQKISIHRSHPDADDGGYMPGTPAERLSEVWDLTRDVWAFFRETNAEQRLQRDVAVLIRGKR
jgi:hypothetical protein